jgi:hypothetical protein
MANTFINSTLLSKEAAVEFELNNTFIATANRKYDGLFTDQTYDAGDTVNIRLDNQFLVKRGDTVTAGDVKETSLPLTLQELYSVPVEYSTVDLSTKLRRNTWMDRVFKPAVRALVSDVNKDIASLAETQTYIHSGTPATSVATFLAIDTLGAILTERGVMPNQDWYCTLNPRDSSTLKAALQNSFNTTLNTEISLRSQLGRLSYFDMMVDQSIAVHTPDTTSIGTPVVNGAVSSGSIINMSGLTPSTAGIVKAGDVISIAGVQSVNRVTRQSTGQDMQWVVTADADSDVSGDIEVHVSPAIISDTANPNRNVTNAVPNAAAVTFNGTNAARNPHKINLAYTQSALSVVTPPLAPLDSPESSVFKDPKTGLSLRVSQTAEVLNNKNVLRIDLLIGYRWFPSQVVRLMS